MSRDGPGALTVVIPTRDRPAHLAACLASLGPELDGGDAVLVVDSASRVPVTADVPVLRLERPGASRARNAGWRTAATDVVVFLDDDVVVVEGWRAALGESLRGVDAVCGAVGLSPAQARAERPVAVTPDVPEHLLADHGGPGASANLAVRREALADVGGFHERLGPGTWFAAAEDVELVDRLVARGHRVRFAPAVLVHHDQWRGRRELLRLDWGYGKGAGARVVLTGRRDRGRARAMARAALWEQGLGPVAGDLRRGYQFGVATGLVRAAGTVAGAVGAVTRADRP